MIEKYLEFEQDGVKYNLYDMPKGFVVKGDLDLSNKGLTELPDLSEVVIEGSFDCSENELTSLKGAPQKVGEYFCCYANQLTDLEGAPQEVGGDFYCYVNKLMTLEGAPKEIGGCFSCVANQELKSLFKIPKMNEDEKLYCDSELAKKYDLPDVECAISNLYASQVYQNEVAIDKLRRQKGQERAKAQEQATNKVRKLFAAWQAQQAQKDGPEK
ncbi:MAG: hypothetical protein IJ770_02325 [Alphaproteobacteria bacterium]|nr:hypothetical protein [Alphaproteobacteria bacterium]